MRHHNRNKKLGRERKVKKGLIKSLSVALIDKGMIRTTLAKAKVLRPAVERFVSHAKVGSQAKIRVLLRDLPLGAVKKLCKDYGPKYKGRGGGYTRIVKAGFRKSDGAKMAFIGFV